MTASADSKNYVHLVTQVLTEKSDATCEMLVKNTADFERAHAGYEAPGKMNDALTLAPDLPGGLIGRNLSGRA